MFDSFCAANRGSLGQRLCFTDAFLLPCSDPNAPVSLGPPPSKGNQVSLPN
jgi:hypothetical protein